MSLVRCDGGPKVRSELLVQPLEKDETTPSSHLSKLYLLLENPRGIRKEISRTHNIVAETKEPSKSQPRLSNIKFTDNPQEIDDFEESDDDSDPVAQALQVSPTTLTSQIPPSIVPTVVAVAKKSYVNDFLIFLSKEKADSNQNTMFTASYIDPSSPEGKLKTRIKSLGDKVSNDRDLRPYTQHIVQEYEQHDPSYNDISYKKYGPKAKGGNPESHTLSEFDMHGIDIEKFINYLKEQGFDESELGFLKKENLNYGPEEIEKELEKIDNARSEKRPSIIQIGGEEGLTSSANASPKIKLHHVLAILILIGL